MVIDSIYIGKPRELIDERGTYISSIQKSPVIGPVQLEFGGLLGDQAANDYHRTLETAVCCHLTGHYDFWRETYGIDLKPGSIGENWIITGASENEFHIGDIYRVGTARVQVSCPRIPCETQARKVGRPDWVQLTLKELRPGFNLRVLDAGIVENGDILELEERLNPEVSLWDLNRCYYHDFDPNLAQRMTTLPGLNPWWQERFAEKLTKLG